MPQQRDLFDLPSARPAPAPVVDRPVEVVHWLVVTTKRARTGCGTIVGGYRRETRRALSEDGASIVCTLDFYDGTVTCQACREAI